MKTILVVEDESDLRTNIKEFLESEDFCVVTAKDGIEGLELTNQYMPDLIICDIEMPRMNGMEMLKRIQNDSSTSSIPFIFLTAKVEMRDVREGMLTGADDYITKPFKLDELIKAVNIRLKKSQSNYTLMEELKNALVRKIPHELRTPLVGILGFSDLIEHDIESLTTEELKLMAEKISTSGKRLHRRIEKFLNYADLLSKSKSEIISSLKQCDIEEDYFKVQLITIHDEENIKERVSLNMEKASVKINERYYLYILAEIVENAVKFSPPNSKIDITGQVDGKNYITKITNEGKGIPPKLIKQISAFKQFSPEAETKEGNGLGLVIVKKITELYDGYLKIESKENEFTTIEVGFPLY